MEMEKEEHVKHEPDATSQMENEKQKNSERKRRMKDAEKDKPGS